MKTQIRVLGVDDSPFKFKDKTADVIGVVARLPAYIEGVLRTQVEVDGRDATEKLIELVSSSKFKAQLKLLMLDGIVFGGFNVIDIEQLHEKTGLPVVTITRRKPDLKSIKKALVKNFKDWRERYALISKGSLIKIETKYNPLFVRYLGIELNTLKDILKLSTIRGVIPEPIRVAHLVASGIVTGESYGRA